MGYLGGKQVSPILEPRWSVPGERSIAEVNISTGRGGQGWIECLEGCGREDSGQSGIAEGEGTRKRGDKGNGGQGREEKQLLIRILIFFGQQLTLMPRDNNLHFDLPCMDNDTHDFIPLDRKLDDAQSFTVIFFVQRLLPKITHLFSHLFGLVSKT